MPKVSQATLIGLGLVGPKARPKGVVDGQLVNIPVQPNFRQSKIGRMCNFDNWELRFDFWDFMLTEGGASSGGTWLDL